jgi:MFS family permease
VSFFAAPFRPEQIGQKKRPACKMTVPLFLVSQALSRSQGTKMTRTDSHRMPPEFTRLMASRFLLTFATQIQAVALGWQMYVLTKNPLYLGFIGLAEAVPALGLALYSGYLVDRSDPLKLFRHMIEISLVSGLILFLSQSNAEDISLSAQVVALFCSSFLTGVARSFAQPTIYAIVPRIVPRDQLPTSSAWMATVLQIARISGPAAGGLLFGWVGIAETALTVCIFLVFSIFLTPSFALPPSATAAEKGGTSFKENLFSGLRFVFAHPILLPALSLDMISVLFGGVTALLPIFAAEILGVGPKGLGILRGAPAIGAALTGLWLTRFDLKARAGRYLFTAVTGFGVCILVFAVSSNLLLSLTALALSGAFDSVSMVIRSSAVQLCSPDQMRGRISAVNSIFIGSSNELGEFESGVLAHFTGIVPAAVFGGVACLATVAAIALLFPKLRMLDLNVLESSTGNIAA